MTTAHTPAPWDTEESSYGDEIWLGGNGAGMIIVNGWINGGCMDNPARWAVVQADARLIAAAPDLLAALQYAAGKLISLAEAETDDQERWIIDDISRVIRATIAKATGEETNA